MTSADNPAGLPLAQQFYDQGGRPPQPPDPLSTVAISFTVAGAATAAVLAERLRELLAADEMVVAVDVVVTTPMGAAVGDDG